ncbi:general substrate transporter [Teratosphaeria nubilosa]|uniref:General substrate transporter n=1 Tax=Teratosphaeria nubilosa TaxID=161662 RepID=A0A6G1L7J9_9PEZI|nr:general substrate transporter [Teratosphaeria nubilosa]
MEAEVDCSSTLITGRYYGLRGQALNIAIGVIAGMDFLLRDGRPPHPRLLLVRLPQIDTRNVSGASHRATVEGIPIGSYNLGCFLGAISCIWIADLLGRKRTIFFGSAIMVIGATIQCASFSLGQLVAGRIITGLGNGMNTSTVPAWQSETSKAHKRGQVVMIEGAMVTYWIDLGLSFAGGSVAWRFPNAFQIVFALIILVVLAALSDLPQEHEDVQSEFVAIKETVLEMAQGSFTDIFAIGRDRNLHRAALGYANQMFPQISGINLITYYAATIYPNSIGLSPFLSRLLAACNGTEYFLASWMPVFTIEKFGRRPPMLFGAAGMSISMAHLAGTTSLQENPSAGIAAAVFVFVFNTFFAIGGRGMTWLYPSEIVPLRIRAPSAALSTSANWISNVTPNRYDKHGHRIISYLDTDEHQRRSSVAARGGKTGGMSTVEKKERSQHNECFAVRRLDS